MLSENQPAEDEDTSFRLLHRQTSEEPSQREKRTKIEFRSCGSKIWRKTESKACIDLNKEGNLEGKEGWKGAVWGVWGRGYRLVAEGVVELGEAEGGGGREGGGTCDEVSGIWGVGLFGGGAMRSGGVKKKNARNKVSSRRRGTEMMEASLGA
nr:hypothetical protein Iba_chr01bCG7350 [Ipomoea batatas]